MSQQQILDDREFGEQFFHAFLGVIQKLHQLELDFIKFKYVKPVATSRLDEIERTTGVQFPHEIRRFLTSVASNIEFTWWRDDGPSQKPLLPKCGAFAMSPVSIAQCALNKITAAQETIFQEHWEGIFPFIDFVNGDYIGISQRKSSLGSIFYLTATESPDCVIKLHHDLQQFLISWVRAGCVYGDDLKSGLKNGWGTDYFNEL